MPQTPQRPQYSKTQYAVWDILDGTETRIAWLKAIAALLSSQAELSDSFNSAYPSKDEIGNIGWLISHLLGETEKIISAARDQIAKMEVQA